MIFIAIFWTKTFKYMQHVKERVEDKLHWNENVWFQSKTKEALRPNRR